MGSCLLGARFLQILVELPVNLQRLHIFFVVGQTPLPPPNKKGGGVHYESYEFTEV